MPVYASIAAYIVIDSLALLMWHQTIFSRFCKETPRVAHLQALIHYYFSQCQPGPLPIRWLSQQILIPLPDWSLDTASPHSIV